MKIALNIFISLFISIGACFAQDTTIDGKQIRLKGFTFHSKKEAIVKKFGKPQKVDELVFECGVSPEEEGIKYYQLAYEHVTFVGNDKEGYGLEAMELNQKSDLAFEYGKYKFTHKLTKEDFLKIFGQSTKKHFNDRGNGVTDFLIFFKGADNGLVFSFKSGYLFKIEFWEPC